MWSKPSFDQWISENRWGNLIMPDIVTGQFKNKAEYKNFVETSPAKLLLGELEYLAK